MTPAPPRSVHLRAEVAQAIRQHARSSMEAEICGVLIGSSDGTTTRVEDCIRGEGAAQGGAHVTFTHQAWENIYKVKDARFPHASIVGWYHSHPGFGVFLSEHDLFIQKHFFSNAAQVAWVYDPHSDEEGCFAWAGDQIIRVADLTIRDGRGADPKQGTTEPARNSPAGRGEAPATPARGRRRRLLGLVLVGTACAGTFVLGLFLGLLLGLQPRTAPAVRRGPAPPPPVSVGSNAPAPRAAHSPAPPAPQGSPTKATNAQERRN